MSVKSEESDQKFREWKADLDERCKKHLEETPERQKPRPSSKKKEFVFPNQMVSVQQNDRDPAIWRVTVNGKVVFLSSGPMAHRDSLKFAQDYINVISKPVGNDRAMGGLPDPCVFCGLRYSHRSECPDLRKPGPDFHPEMNPGF